MRIWLAITLLPPGARQLLCSRCSKHFELPAASATPGNLLITYFLCYRQLTTALDGFFTAAFIALQLHEALPASPDLTRGRAFVGAGVWLNTWNG
jgi:hypothetical protein